jgi:hypothetical protein
MKYRGLCIGGPNDGEYMTADVNLVRIPQPDGEVLYRRDGSMSNYQPHTTFSYIFCTRYWVPYNALDGIKPLTAVLDAIDAAYVAYARERKANVSEEV